MWAEKAQEEALVRRIRTLIVSLATLVLVVMSGPQAFAHHGDGSPGNYWQEGIFHNVAEVWGNSGTETFCIGTDFYDNFGAATMDNMENTSNVAADQWTNNTQFNRQFNHESGPECTNAYSYRTRWENAQVTKGFGEDTLEEFCQNYSDGISSRIEYEQLDWRGGTGAFALMQNCDVNEDDKTDFFVIVIDVRADDWHFDTSPPTANHELSYWAVITHEFGHVLGFGDLIGSGDHWPNDTETCPNNGNHNTMCQDSWGFKDGAGGTADATIESHDIGKVNQHY